MNPKCKYEVRTYWGSFRLDEGAYRDYLEGKLWITWVPGKGNRTTNKTVRPDATEEALKLRDRAECTDPYLVYTELSTGTAVWPYKEKMKNYAVADMQLSVRSSNGLRRAGIDNLGILFDVISEDGGLRNIRNLGAKSETEITVCFFNTCYSLLDDFEKAMWWQEISS